MDPVFIVLLQNAPCDYRTMLNLSVCQSIYCTGGAPDREHHTMQRAFWSREIVVRKTGWLVVQAPQGAGREPIPLCTRLWTWSLFQENWGWLSCTEKHWCKIYFDLQIVHFTDNYKETYSINHHVVIRSFWPRLERSRFGDKIAPK